MSEAPQSLADIALMSEMQALRRDINTNLASRETHVSQLALTTQSVLNLTKRVDEFAERDQQDHKHLSEGVEAIHALLDGAGDNPGFRVRLDRVEQTQAAQKRIQDWFGRVLAALVASGLTAVIAWVIHSIH